MKTLRILPSLFAALLVMSGISSEAQVKINDGADITINPNSMLELESTNKGLLITRIAINSLILPAPLTAPVPVGMLVYSTGGTVRDGFYYWDGISWERVISTGANILKTFTRSVNATLSKSDNIIFNAQSIARR